MRLELDTCIVRSWREEDAPSLAEHANDREIWLNLRDAFPYPYVDANARSFIQMARERRPETLFAIDVGGHAVGGIGFSLHQDVERVSAEIGYWLGRAYWGRGITTDALKAVTTFAVETHGLTRVYALPFAWNAASCRVLEKAGYVLEARLRRSAIKDGQIIDQFQYAYIVSASNEVP